MCMPKQHRNYHGQMIYLEPERAKALAALSKATRIPKAALLREAVELLLAKHGVRQTDDPVNVDIRKTAV
jgi:hypothetical protein